MATSSLSTLPQVASGAATSMKDFLTKKEKVNGVFWTLLLGGLGLYFLGPVVLPTVLSVLGMLDQAVSMTAALAIKGVLLFGLLFFLSRPRTWTLGWHLFDMFSKFLSKLMLKIDPIGRMKAYAREYLESKKQKVVHALEVVTAQRMASERRVAKYTTDIAEARETADGMRELAFDGQSWADPDHEQNFRLRSMEVRTWTRSLKRSESQLARLKLQEELLTKFLRGYEFWIESVRILVDDAEVEFEASRGMAEAASAISSTVGGGDDQAAFFDEAYAYVQSQINTWNAQVEVVMGRLPEFTKLYDAEGDLAELRLMQELQTLDAGASDLLLDAERTGILLQQGEGGLQRLGEVARQRRTSPPGERAIEVRDYRLLGD